MISEAIPQKYPQKMWISPNFVCDKELSRDHRICSAGIAPKPH